MTFERLQKQTKHLAVSLTIGATLTMVAPARAQFPVLSGGTHVKLWLGPNQPRIQGTVFSQTADTLRVASDGVVRVVPVSMIGGVEVGGGRSHTAGAVHGAKIGAMIVGGAGAVIFTSVYATYDGEKHPEELAYWIVMSGVSGAFYGAIIGAVAGAEAWTPVYPVRVSLAVTRPRANATGIGLSFKF